MRHKLLVTAVTWAVISTTITTSVFGSSLKDKKDELSANKEQIKEQKKELEETKEEKASVQSEVTTLDSQLVEIESQLSEIEKNLAGKKASVSEKAAELKVLEKELEESEVEKDEYYEAFKGRMVQMYKNKKRGFLELILSSDSIGQALTRAEYIKRISTRDEKVFEDLQEVVEDITTKKENVISVKATLEQEQKAIEISLAEQEKLQNSVESTRSKKLRLITQLEDTEASIEGQISALEKEAQDLEAEIKKLTAAANSSSQYNGGEMVWPVPGNYRVSSGYGYRNSPIFGKQEFHTGIDIPASYGTPVVASADGTVIYSGVRGGYGNTVMIDHGSGIVSLYGHNSSLAVSVGQTVKKGQTIAGIGSTGWSTGNHLHFEIRKNGGHISPWTYIKK